MFAKSGVWPKKYSAAAGMIPKFRGAAGKGFWGFPSQAVEMLAPFLLDSCCTTQCHLGSGPEGQNIQRNTGGMDPISKHLTMGALKLHKYSLSEFQWWFWISQLPSRISKNKRIKPNSFECRIALEGEGGFSVGNSYIWIVQIGSVSRVVCLTAAFSCLELFCSVGWVAITANCLSSCPLTYVLLAAVVPRIQWP